jgi:hypothetical protein
MHLRNILCHLPPPNLPRRGRNKVAVLRALIGYGKSFTTRQLFQFCYPRLPDRRQPKWRWQAVRDAAERAGLVRARKRTRPLHWIAKP